MVKYINAIKSIATARKLPICASPAAKALCINSPSIASDSETKIILAITAILIPLRIRTMGPFGGFALETLLLYKNFLAVLRGWRKTANPSESNAVLLLVVDAVSSVSCHDVSEQL